MGTGNREKHKMVNYYNRVYGDWAILSRSIEWIEYIRFTYNTWIQESSVSSPSSGDANIIMHLLGLGTVLLK